MVAHKRAAPSAYVPDVGDLIWISFDPQAGHEQAGKRPALVVSPRPYNSRAGLALVCPITTQVKGYPFEVLLPPDLPVRGVILSDQIKSVDWKARRAKRACPAPINVINQVRRLITTLIGI